MLHVGCLQCGYCTPELDLWGGNIGANRVTKDRSGKAAIFEFLERLFGDAGAPSHSDQPLRSGGLGSTHAWQRHTQKTQHPR